MAKSKSSEASHEMKHVAAEGHKAAKAVRKVDSSVYMAEVLGILPLLQRLPRRLDRITAAIERNQFSANIRLFSDAEDARLVSRLVSRAVMAFMGVGVAIASVLLLGMSGGPRITSTLTVFQLFGYSGLFCSVVLLLRVLVAIARERVG